MDLRAYARAKKAYEEDIHIPELNKRRNSPLIEQVRAQVFEFAKEKIDKLNRND